MDQNRFRSSMVCDWVDLNFFFISSILLVIRKNDSYLYNFNSKVLSG